MSAREEILAKLRVAVEGAADVAVSRAYRRDEDGGDDLLPLLVDRLVDYKATVRQGDDVALLVGECLAGVGSVVVPAGLPGEWLEAYGGEVLRDGDTPLTVAELDGAGAVVTGCAVAIAATGTIVLDGGPDQGRRALTLVPDHHVCVVRADQIVRGVPAGVARLDPRRPLTWISGPSATSDIELNRVEGVHGPRRLDVILVS